jgi:mono/diheme cytochrome c family protein
MALRKFTVLGVILLLGIFLAACSGSSKGDPLLTKGEKLYTTNCLSCHPTDPEQPRVGPYLVGLGAQLQASGQDAEDILQESIREPGKVLSTGYQNLMPAADVLGLSGEDIDALVAYLIGLEE